MKMSRCLFRLVSVAGLIALGATCASAHPGHETGFTVIDGALHPLNGADHLAAMIAVGLWAALAGGRRIWVWPLAFVSMMLVGGFIGHAGIAMPTVEPMIATSVIALGLLVGLGILMPVVPGAVLIGMFALFHGHAHGAEAPAAGWLGYATGFAASTTALHIVGIVIGLALARFAGRIPVQAIGAATAALGIVLLIG
jgi:urease accessory protein